MANERRKSFSPRKPRDLKTEKNGPFLLYGRHTVEAALSNPARRCHLLYASQNGSKRLLDGLTGPLEIPMEILPPKQLDKLVGPEAVHQGLILKADPLPPSDLSDLQSPHRLLLLDQITDPHNVGAILRTACAMQIDAVITTTRYSPADTSMLAKAASGALDLLTRIEVKNLARAVTELNARGIVTIALDSQAPNALSNLAINNSEPIALILGAEGKGIRPGIRDICQHQARLDMPGPIKSLNVSVAAAICMTILETM